MECEIKTYFMFTLFLNFQWNRDSLQRYIHESNIKIHPSQKTTPVVKVILPYNNQSKTLR